MRIISGAAARTPLAVPETPATRPLLEMARGALANALAPRLPGAAVLDLYAGSGAFGLEMWSRGARRVVCVEADRSACRTLRANIRRCGAMDDARVMEGLAGRQVRHLSRDGALFDIIFVDPPFRLAASWRDDPDAAQASRLLPGLLAPEGVMLFRLEDRRAAPPVFDGLSAGNDRKYGRSRIVEYRRAA